MRLLLKRGISSVPIVPSSKNRGSVLKALSSLLRIDVDGNIPSSVGVLSNPDGIGGGINGLLLLLGTFDGKSKGGIVTDETIVNGLSNTAKRFNIGVGIYPLNTP